MIIVPVSPREGIILNRRCCHCTCAIALTTTIVNLVTHFETKTDRCKTTYGIIPFPRKRGEYADSENLKNWNALPDILYTLRRSG